MISKHEMAIALLVENRDYWLSRIDTAEKHIAAHKENIIRLRDDKEVAATKVSELDQSIAALKAAP